LARSCQLIGLCFCSLLQIYKKLSSMTRFYTMILLV